MNKIRVRFGIRLSWPITNAATFVIYLAPETWDKVFDGMVTVRGLLNVAGYQSIADRIICERS